MLPHRRCRMGQASCMRHRDQPRRTVHRKVHTREPGLVQPSAEQGESDRYRAEARTKNPPGARASHRPRPRQRAASPHFGLPFAKAVREGDRRRHQDIGFVGRDAVRPWSPAPCLPSSFDRRFAQCLATAWSATGKRGRGRRELRTTQAAGSGSAGTVSSKSRAQLLRDFVERPPARMSICRAADAPKVHQK